MRSHRIQWLVKIACCDCNIVINRMDWHGTNSRRRQRTNRISFSIIRTRTWLKSPCFIRFSIQTTVIFVLLGFQIKHWFALPRPLWDGRPHDVYHHIPAGCRYGSGGLEAQDVGLQLVLCVRTLLLLKETFHSFFWPRTLTEDEIRAEMMSLPDKSEDELKNYTAAHHQGEVAQFTSPLGAPLFSLCSLWLRWLSSIKCHTSCNEASPAHCYFLH